MLTQYQLGLCSVEIEYDGNVLYALRCRGQHKEITPQMLGKRSKFSDCVYCQIKEFLAGERKAFDVDFKLCGTDFQKKVWAALLEIPYGTTKSYKEIAQAVNSPKACRAVGMACNKNPIMIIVPCHRVIGSNGQLVGWAGGLEIKKALLETEKRTVQKELIKAGGAF
ncbi:MAG: methylated-DNA--[protein]-cysteine S-methyltransferase [Clostridiales bacterium]|nr:methylated-DNA--[protein]-cysteine S-methyltransferase [Clostridiales bacterium]